MPIRQARETAISSLTVSRGDHRLLEVVGEGALDPDMFPGGGVVGSSNDILATSRSQTCATIKQITAKLPITR